MRLVHEALNASGNLFSAKTRSFLAMLGVLIGAAAVVALLYCGQIATDEAVKPFKSMGVNLLNASFSANQGRDEARMPSGQALAQLVREVRGISDFSPMATIFQRAHINNHELDGQIAVVGGNFSELTKSFVELGRGFSPYDLNQPYCVVGADIVKQMRRLGQFVVVGQKIRLGDTFCQVIGVPPEYQQNWFIPFNLNQAIMVQFGFAQQHFSRVKISSVLFLLAEGVNPSEAQFGKSLI